METIKCPNCDRRHSALQHRVFCACGWDGRRLPDGGYLWQQGVRRGENAPRDIQRDDEREGVER